MAVRRRQSWNSQQRVDISHLRSVESAASNDFDELVSSFATGGGSYVIRGFDLDMASAVGSAATSLLLIVDNSSMFHGSSATSGTFFQVASGTADEPLNPATNAKVSGSFTPSATNFIALDFSRQIDSATVDQVRFWNPTTLTEFGKTVPLAQTLNFTIVITPSIFAADVLPIATVDTDASNNVVSVQDRRPMLFRLGAAGSSTPNPFNVYPWSNHTEGRAENFWESSSTTSPFRGGDKQILHFKEWADAVMSNILEIKGSTYWYSPSTAGSILKLRGDLANTYMTGSGKFTHHATTSGQINWGSDLFLNFVGSRLKYTIESNAATTDVILSDDQVGYIKIIRGVDIGPNLIWTNSSTAVSSVGAASWTGAVAAGDFIKLKTDDDSQYYEISTVDSVSAVTLVDSFDGISTGASGTDSQYAFGKYRTDPTPSTDRHVKIDDRKDVAFDEDTYWLYLREDDSGGTPKIYIRGFNGELEKGEERSVSDNQSDDILTYVGAAGETDSDPDYVTTVAGSLALPNYNTSNGESLTTRLSKITAMLADHTQNLNVELDPGSVVWNGTSITITSAQLSIPGTTVGAAPVSINTFGPSALASNSALYVDISRTSGTALTLTSATIASLTPSQQRLVIARNVSGTILTR